MYKGEITMDTEGLPWRRRASDEEYKRGYHGGLVYK